MNNFYIKNHKKKTDFLKTTYPPFLFMGLCQFFSLKKIDMISIKSIKQIKYEMFRVLKTRVMNFFISKRQLNFI